MRETQEWVEIGQRIREARIVANLSQEALGGKVDLDRTMINKIEQGARRVDAVELARICSTLSIPLGHILSPQPVVSHRQRLLDEDPSVASRSTYRVDAALFAWLRDVRQMVGAGLLRPRPVATFDSVNSDKSARAAAAQLRSKLGLGNDPIDYLIEVAERAGLLIAVMDLDGDGASIHDGDLAVAVVSTQGEPGRRRATAAHELGHTVLGDEYSNELGVHASRGEREAVIDAFASEFLLPLGALGSGSATVSRADLIGLAATYRVSWGVAVKQASRIGWLDPGVAREWEVRTPTHADFMDALGWRPEPDLTGLRVPAAFKSAVSVAQRTGAVTAARAVEMMRGESKLTDFPPADAEDPQP